MRHLKKGIFCLGFISSLTLSNYQVLDACATAHNEYAFDDNFSGPNVLVWLDMTNANGGVIKTALVDSNGLLGESTTLSSEGKICITPKVAYTNNGDAVVSWLAYDLSSPTTRLYSSFLPTGGDWTPEVLVSDNEEGVISDTVNLSISNQGNPNLSWESIVFRPNPNNPSETIRQINLRRSNGKIANEWSAPYTLVQIR